MNWYPNKWNQKEAIWTKKHIESLDPHAENQVFHVQVRHGKFGFHSYPLEDRGEACILTVNTRIWFLIELLTTLLLWYVLIFKVKKKKVDVYNFHITYPLLTYSRIITFFIRKPIFVTEHWSAYHLNFGVKKELKRIKRIFSNKKLKFIVVSKALLNDIQTFSGEVIESYLVPNVIDAKLFYHQKKERNKRQIFMLSYWKVPKKPLVVFEAIKRLTSDYPDVELHVGGFGPQLEDMKAWIANNEMEDRIQLLGSMDSKEIGNKMSEVGLFAHCSDYEVASVVCMESVCCGTPVVASNVGGIGEYVDNSIGRLVNGNDPQNWESVIREALEVSFDYKMISEKSLQRFSFKGVGQKYAETILGNKA